MSGEWLTRIGRAIVSPATFDRLIAPAIADLQVESLQGSLLRWRHYLGIITVLGHALAQDLRVEVSFALDAEARRRAWTRAAAWYGAFVVVLTAVGLRYNLPQNLPLHGRWGAALTSTGLEAIIVATIPGMTAGALYLARRSCSRRSIVLVTLLVATLMTAFALTVRPLRVSADAIVLNAALSQPDARAGHYFSERLDTRVMRWRDLQTGIQIIPFALLGILLAPRRGWNVALGVAAYFASWMLVVVLGFVVLAPLASDSIPSRVVQGWVEIALNFSALLLVYIVDKAGRAAREIVR